jgi:hypothetical protein
MPISNYGKVKNSIIEIGKNPQESCTVCLVEFQNEDSCR